ncbi:glycine cleavage system H protein [Bacteriovorax sp. BSW11_IV]|uniref:glycine cleavage system protein GcvH n=1 Tax=Bacteriovorax sp. BSW11_IV TaxID=1353529 RepID=UPI00038A25F1|nr:glycine cleavage system protein GcvH [Bacteriovorax sp. BSW11_IV]EQC45136.1 glycine cleavage system H protein [Bacteriovorax sp. BSW11_IV]
MSHQVPSTLKYTKDHEWAKIEGDIVTIGITDFAQSALGDIVFVELPEVGSTLDQASTFGVVESIKSVSDLYSPITGEVVEANNELESSPELCNQSPYDSWIIKVKATNLSELDSLLSSADYEQHCSEL